MFFVADDLCKVLLAIGFDFEATIDGTEDTGCFFPGLSVVLAFGSGHGRTRAAYWRDS